MMQAPKYQFTRKSRKPLSRDRKELGSFQGSRQKSRDSQEKKIGNENSPNKPHMLISNLRYELTNLRQQVAKLSKRDHKRPPPSNDTRVQYQPKSPKQVKNIYSYYFEDVKSTLPQSESNSTPRNSDDNQVLRAKSRGKVDELQKLKQQIAEIQVKNSELVKTNEELSERLKELGERLKSEYQCKIHQIEVQKQRGSRQKQTQENDRTINYQRQVLDNKKLIEQLKDKVNSFAKENEDLKIDAQKYRECHEQLQKEKMQLMEKENIIADMELNLHSLKQEISSLVDDLSVKKNIEIENLQLKKEMKDMNATIEEAKIKIEALTKRNAEIQKKLQKYGQKNEGQTQPKRKAKTVKIQGPQDAKQLYEIIAMQEKSLLNQQSDINYLQSEVRKLSFFKHLSKNQSEMLGTLNEQFALLQLIHLNQKYQLLEQP